MRWFLLLALISIISCAEKKPSARAVIFNCDSLINFHLNYLSKSGSSLEKTSAINGVVSTARIEDPNINWENELESFRVLSLINKPVYLDAYTLRISPDEKSNLTIKSWVANTNVLVRSLKLYYLKNPTQIKKMEAMVEQNNFVFISTKSLILEFNIPGNPPRPERYEISGTQKFFWGAPQYYSLEGFIKVK